MVTSATVDEKRVERNRRSQREHHRLGGDDPNIAVLPWRILFWIGIDPAAPVDHRLNDGDPCRPIALTAHVTGGHTRGCTTWSFKVRDGDLDLDVVSSCSPKVIQGTRYPTMGRPRARLPRPAKPLVDTCVTSHARLWGRKRKFVASQTAKNPVDSFVDPGLSRLHRHRRGGISQRSHVLAAARRLRPSRTT